jgi:hypothetical protein
MEVGSGERGTDVAGLRVSEMGTFRDSLKASSRDLRISEAGRGQALGYRLGLTGYQEARRGGFVLVSTMSQRALERTRRKRSVPMFAGVGSV